MANYMDQAIASLRRFEGSVPWMYLDRVGKVTVGVGLMLSNEEAAHALPFLRGTVAASIVEITQDFARVSGMKPGELAKLYREVNGLELSEETIDDRLRQTVVGFEDYLRSHLADYDTLPDAAKLALIDMIYNLGPGKLFAEYGRLMQAVAEKNWTAAAGASLRRGPSAARNSWTRQQFLAAAKVEVAQIKAEATGRSRSPLLLGVLSGLAMAAATAIMVGELDHIAAARRRRASNAD